MPDSSTAAVVRDRGASGPDGDESGGPPAPEDDAESSDAVRMPAGLDPESLVRSDLSTLLKDPRLNPEGRRLGRLEAAWLNQDLVRARNVVEEIEAEVEIILAEAVEDLTERGEFLEYAETDPPPPSPAGIVTVGEQTRDGTIRFFALGPEEFPDIYERRETRGVVSANAIHSLLSALQTP